jgi:hypothetical protein
MRTLSSGLSVSPENLIRLTHHTRKLVEDVRIFVVDFMIQIRGCPNEI